MKLSGEPKQLSVLQEQLQSIQQYQTAREAQTREYREFSASMRDDR
jgi:hypothetical protein